MIILTQLSYRFQNILIAKINSECWYLKLFRNIVFGKVTKYIQTNHDPLMNIFTILIHFTLEQKCMKVQIKTTSWVHFEAYFFDHLLDYCYETRTQWYFTQALKHLKSSRDVYFDHLVSTSSKFHSFSSRDFSRSSVCVPLYIPSVLWTMVRPILSSTYPLLSATQQCHNEKSSK